MSTLYGATQRAFQDRFDTRRLADKVEAIAIHSEMGDMDRAFIDILGCFNFAAAQCCPFWTPAVLFQSLSSPLVYRLQHA